MLLLFHLRGTGVEDVTGFSYVHDTEVKDDLSVLDRELEFVCTLWETDVDLRGR